MDIPQITGAPTQNKTEAAAKNPEDGAEWVVAFASSLKAEPEETVEVFEPNLIDLEVSPEGDNPDLERGKAETVSENNHDAESDTILLELTVEETSPNVPMFEQNSEHPDQISDPMIKMEHPAPDVAVVQEAISTLGLPEVKGLPVQTLASNERLKPTYINGQSGEMSVAKTIIDAASRINSGKINAMRSSESPIVDPAEVEGEIKKLAEPQDVRFDRRDAAVAPNSQIQKSGGTGDRQQIASALPPPPILTQSAVLTGVEQAALSVSQEGESALISQDRIGLSSAVAPASVSSAIAATEAKPRAVMYQISQAVSESGTNDIELRLDPAELGKVRISMSVRDGQMIATIFAERPETLDLLRRNADDLRAEFSEQGLGDASLNFEQSDQNEGSNEPRKDQFSNFDVDVVPSSEPLLPQSISISTGLDVRL